jgi:hypothetical protein
MVGSHTREEQAKQRFACPDMLGPSLKEKIISATSDGTRVNTTTTSPLSSLKSYSPLIKKLNRSKEGSDEDSDSGQNNSIHEAIRREGRRDANSNGLFTSLADIAMDRKDEIGDDLGDDHQRARTFETELSEYLDEPLLTNRNIKQY